MKQISILLRKFESILNTADSESFKKTNLKK